MQPSQDVENAISDLIQAKEKIKHLEATNKSWQDCYAKSNEQRNEAEAELLQATEKIVELEKEIERLNTKPRSFSFEKLLEAFVQQKKELKYLKDNAQFERDSILSEIRKVLGAQDRTEDKPHETALNAAKRVMEDFKNLRDNDLAMSKNNEAALRRELKEEWNKVRRLSSYEESYQTMYKLFGRLQDLVLGKDSTTETYEDLYKPIKDLVVVKNEVCTRLGPGSAHTAETILKNIRMLDKKEGARTYTPPEGWVLIKEDSYEELVNNKLRLNIIKDTLDNI